MTDKQKQSINRIKSLFQTYFNGCYGVEPIASVPLSTLEVTDLQFDFEPEIKNKVGNEFENYDVALTVTLGRPGLLIGKMGRTIKELEDRFSTDDEKVKILIKESTLWQFIK